MNTEDELRERLLLAETRILNLEKLVRDLRTARLAKPKHLAPYENEVIKKRASVYQMTGGFCFYCRERMTVEEFTVDHLIPRSEGGTNMLRNLVPACRRCNHAKGDRMPTAQETEYATFLYRGTIGVRKKELRDKRRARKVIPITHESRQGSAGMF